MRDIKFRFWDKARNKFTDYGAIHLSGSIMTYSATFGGMYDFVSEENEKDIVVQQYTGLKDKNGVEIYEGDLVKTSYHTNKVFHYGLVDWVDYGFGIRRRDTTTSNKPQVFGAAPLPDSSRIEVIGNIYENPELLK